MRATNHMVISGGLQAYPGYVGMGLNTREIVLSHWRMRLRVSKVQEGGRDTAFRCRVRCRD